MTQVADFRDYQRLVGPRFAVGRRITIRMYQISVSIEQMIRRTSDLSNPGARLWPAQYPVWLDHVMNTRAFTFLTTLTVAALMASCTPKVHVVKAQLPALSLELANVQEEYLNAHQPRPTGKDGIRAEAPELQRRLSLVIETWDDYVRGQVDAQHELSSRHVKLLGFRPLNEYERTYVELLRRDLGIEFVTVGMPVTEIHRAIYIYGYNSTVGRQLENKHGLMKFVDLIKSAVRQHTADEHPYYSPFFIPSRFNFDNGIQVIQLVAEPTRAASSTPP